MDGIYKIIDEYNPCKERKILIAFADMIADMFNNTVVTELIIRGGKLNIHIVFITQSYFAVPNILD